MYINLPSKNHYRRPASYASKGYHTRRMAVDFAVPLITNVKNAKILAEALIRKLPLDVTSIDAKSSYETHTFPGLVNVAAFVPRVGDLGDATKASVRGGFTTTVVLPVGDGEVIEGRVGLEAAKAGLVGAAHCNVALSIAAGVDSKGAKDLDDELQADVKSLFVPGKLAISTISKYFGVWSADRPIVTDAKGAELASILLVASLNGRSVHVTNVQSADDLTLIGLSKGKGLGVTCDVSVYSLFFAREDFGGCEALPTRDDLEGLWGNLESIDAFSVGPSPYHLAKGLKGEGSVVSGVEEALPLLLTAVAQGKLSLDDIRKRLHDNPIAIFGIPEQTQTTVEVVLGRKAPFKTSTATWSPLDSKVVSAFVHRVVIHGQTVYLDGALSAQPHGRDISATVVHPSTAPAAHATKETAGGEHASPVSTNTGMLPLMASGALLQPSTSSLSHLQQHPAFHRRHILSIKQFVQRDIHHLFALAHEMRLQVERNGTLDVLKGKVLCTAFYEPSTRTSSSFDAAMKRCGGQVVQIHADMSSAKKGETLADTVRTLACYGDAIVLRHPDVGSAQLAAKYSSVPIINAGDGIGEHPTQVRVLFRSSYLFHPLSCMSAC